MDRGDVARELLRRAYAQRGMGPKGVELLPLGQVAEDVGLGRDALHTVVEFLERGGYIGDVGPQIGVRRGDAYTITPSGKAWLGE
jgi:hypothetical protein